MAIMRGSNSVSGKVQNSNYPRDNEPVVSGVKADKMDPKYAGIADKANYTGKTAAMK